MAFYTDEEEVWKCQLHPSRRRTIGVCPHCLRERLSTLCPDCANVRPCPCCCTTSSSSSSSSATSVFYAPADTSGSKVSNLIENEPSFRRSRSVAFFPFFKSARYSSATAIDLTDRKDSDGGESISSEAKGIRSKNSNSRSSLLMFFWPNRFRKEKLSAPAVEDVDVRDMRRSRSVAAVFTRRGGGQPRDQEMRSSGKSKGWYYFPSPMKAFRPKASAKIVQDHSPLHRG